MTESAIVAKSNLHTPAYSLNPHQLAAMAYAVRDGIFLQKIVMLCSLHNWFKMPIFAADAFVKSWILRLKISPI